MNHVALNPEADPLNSRELILAEVVARPGIWPREISRRLDLSYTWITKALEELETEGHVEFFQEDRERHYFPRLTSWEKRFLAFIQTPEVWRLLLHLADHGGQQSRETLTDAVGLSSASVGRYTVRLMEMGILEKAGIPTGRRPAVAYILKWESLLPSLRLLAVKLGPENREAKDFRALARKVSASTPGG